MLENRDIASTWKLVGFQQSFKFKPPKFKISKYIFTYHVSKKNYDSTIHATFGDFENWHLLQTVLFLIPKRKIRF